MTSSMNRLIPTLGVCSCLCRISENPKAKLYTIPGSPPNLLRMPKGDAFAPRNPYALGIDFEQEPPMFSINEHHSAATWLLHPEAPKIDRPQALQDRINQMKEEVNHGE